MKQNQHYVLSNTTNYSYLQTNSHPQTVSHVQSNSLHQQNSNSQFQLNSNYMQNNNSQFQNHQPSKILGSNYMMNNNQKHQLVYNNSRVVNSNHMSPYVTRYTNNNNNNQLKAGMQYNLDKNASQQRIVTNSVVHLTNNSVRSSSINNVHLLNKSQNLKPQPKQNSYVTINQIKSKQYQNHQYIDNLISSKLGNQQCLENRIQDQIRKIQNICQSQVYKVHSQDNQTILKQQSQRVESIISNQQQQQDLNSQFKQYQLRSSENNMQMEMDRNNKQDEKQQQQQQQNSNQQQTTNQQSTSRSQSVDSFQQQQIQVKGNDNLAHQRSQGRRSGFFYPKNSDQSVELSEDSLFSLDDCKLVVKRDIPHFKILNENNMLFNRNKLNHNESDKKRNGHLDQLQNCLVFLNMHK